MPPNLEEKIQFFFLKLIRFALHLLKISELYFKGVRVYVFIHLFIESKSLYKNFKIVGVIIKQDL